VISIKEDILMLEGGPQGRKKCALVKPGSLYYSRANPKGAKAEISSPEEKMPGTSCVSIEPLEFPYQILL